MKIVCSFTNNAVAKVKEDNSCVTIWCERRTAVVAVGNNKVLPQPPIVICPVNPKARVCSIVQNGKLLQAFVDRFDDNLVRRFQREIGRCVATVAMICVVCWQSALCG